MLAKKSSLTRMFMLALVFLLVLAFSQQLFAQAQKASGQEDYFDMSIEDLMNIEVTTASKRTEKIQYAPSIMTVVTSADIKRAGHKTLEEVLQRVVGFYPKMSGDWGIVASRGIDADMNHQYLFLIDGHNINSVNGWGARNQHQLPLLSHVDRIEIIRGPGSTLWGSDAALGIINIITKEGGQIDGVHISTDYSDEDKQRSHNILAGKQFDKGSYMVSATYFDSRGWGESGGGPNWYHGKDEGSQAWHDWQDFEPSWEIYGKARTGPWTILARKLYWDEVRRRSTQHSRSNRFYDNTFIEISHLKELGDVTSLETKVFADHIFKEQYPLKYVTNDRRETYEEKGYGAEMMLSTILAEKHNVIFGARVVRTKVGPNKRKNNYNPITHEAGSISLRTQSGVDRTYAVYAEDHWDVTDRFRLIFGARYDDNHFREKKSKLLPRFGAIYALNDNWTAKYLYNSGYMRPAVNQGKRQGGTVRNATKGQEINSHDWQLAYNGEKTSFSATVFYLMVKDYITFLTSPYGYENVSDGDSRGIELEFRRKFNDSLSIYGNYAYALAEMDTVNSDLSPNYVNEHGEWNGMPHQLFNVGTDWLIKDDLTFNLHARGWKDAKVYAWDGKAGINRFKRFGTNIYLDANLLYTNVKGLPLDVSLYCTNLLDRRGKNPLYSKGWALEKGRSFGFRVTYKF